MGISLRLQKVAALVEVCDCVADIGTDHGYLPIYLVKNNICKSVIASDINKGPVEKARLNISMENMESKIECRLGGGFSILSHFEVDAAVIAGMGGNLIRDIIEEGIEVFKELKFVVLQPVQNPDILRKYIYEKGYKIIDEDLCIEDNKYYEIIKITYDEKPKIKSNIYYEISEILLEKKHPLIEEYIIYKIEKYSKIFNSINEKTNNSECRKKEIKSKISDLKELLACL